MAADPKDITQPDINVYVSQLCEEIRALKNRVNLMETRSIRTPDGEILSALPPAALRALKTCTFDALGDVEASAPVEGDYSSYAVELANRLKRDGTQPMLGLLTLFGNAVTDLQAVPKQQVPELALTAVEQYRGSDTRISALPLDSYEDEHYSTMLVKLADGRVAGWGRATVGKTATGNADDGSIRPGIARFFPSVPSGVSVTSLVLNGGGAFAILSNGWVYYAGLNSRGVAGLGDTTSRYVFTRISYFYTNSLSVTAVSATTARDEGSYEAAIFLCSNGDVYFSGSAAFGTAGDGNTAQHQITTPTKCLTVANAVGISYGGDVYGSVFAWKSDGSCYAWGGNFQGGLGLGSTSTVATPTLVAGVAVQKVASRVAVNSSAVRYGFSLFLLQDGTVKAAGNGSSGQLGNGGTADSTIPVVVSGLSNVVDVGCGGGDFGFAWAVNTSSQLWMWGNNAHGQLGIGSTTNSTVPVQPIGWIDTDGTVITTGAAPFQGKVSKVITGKTFAGGPIGRGQTLVLDTDGNVWVAGMNDAYVAGVPDTTQLTRFKKVSVEAVEPGDKIVDIRTQGHSTVGSGMRIFALTQRGKLLACGINNYDLITGIPGTGTTNYRAVFLQPIRLGV